MNKSESNEMSKLRSYKDEVDIMLSEIEDWKNQLTELNEGLLEASKNTCSEYGDRIMETTQSKLFYLQRVLRMSVNALVSYKEKLAIVIEKGDANLKAELKGYQKYCRESAEKIKGKLEKYSSNTQSFIDRNCGTA